MRTTGHKSNAVRKYQREGRAQLCYISNVLQQAPATAGAVAQATSTFGSGSSWERIQRQRTEKKTPSPPAAASRVEVTGGGIGGMHFGGAVGNVVINHYHNSNTTVANNGAATSSLKVGDEANNTLQNN